jgi:hypothetical protein
MQMTICLIIIFSAWIWWDLFRLIHNFPRVKPSRKYIIPDPLNSMVAYEKLAILFHHPQKQFGLKLFSVTLWWWKTFDSNRYAPVKFRGKNKNTIIQCTRAASAYSGVCTTENTLWTSCHEDLHAWCRCCKPIEQADLSMKSRLIATQITKKPSCMFY